MRLQAQLPLRMRQAVLDRRPGVLLKIRPVHGLQPQLPKRQFLEPLRLGPWLRVDELQLVAGRQDEISSRLGADADDPP